MTFVAEYNSKHAVNSEWQPQQEVVALAKAIAAQSQDACRAFADKLLQAEPDLANLIPKRSARD